MAYHRERKSARFEIESTIFVSTPSHGPATEKVKSIDLCLRGSLLVGEEFYGVGRVLTLDIVIENSRQPVRAISKVVHEYRDLEGRICTGVEFLFISDGQHKVYDSFLSHLDHEEQATLTA